MNRRGFFKTLATVAAGVALAPAVVLREFEKHRASHGLLMFKGVPLVFDEHCPSNTIYFLSSNGPYRLVGNSKTWEQLGSQAIK